MGVILYFVCIAIVLIIYAFLSKLLSSKTKNSFIQIISCFDSSSVKNIDGSDTKYPWEALFHNSLQQLNLNRFFIFILLQIKLFMILTLNLFVGHYFIIHHYNNYI